MDIQQPKIDLKNVFELYLEGIKVDFSAITISEVEGGIPAASITFPSSYGATRILPSTIVQIFGYLHAEKKNYLLFEGEVTSINYQKSTTNKIVVLKAISLISSMIKAKFRPSDAILTQERKSADGLQGAEAIIINEKGADIPVGPTTVSNFSNISNKDTQVVKGKLRDIGITAAFGLTDEFKRALADDQPGGKGDFLPMLQNFNKQFEYNDLFYGLRSLAYKFGRSIFASPNPDLLNSIKVNLFQDSLNTLHSFGIKDIFSEKPYTLMQVLTEFQKYLHYDFISPAAYTSCKPFYVNGVKENLEPIRMFFMPKIEAGPPALCNIFFPEQVGSFTYSRDMMNEPTRIVGKSHVSFIQQTNNNIDFSPCITFPEINLEDGLASGNYTTEETYRGINPKVITYSNLQSNLIIEKKRKNDSGKVTSKNEKLSEAETRGDIGNIIKPFAYMDYTQMKYASRSISLTSEWNPYRMIGLAGLLLDSDGLSIVGTVNSIETNIVAQGVATSRVIMRSVRLIHDAEFETNAFSKIPDDNPTGYEKYIIHDLTNDGMMATNELLFYKNLYSFENIGKDVYTYIMHGQLSPAHGFYDAQQNEGVFEYAKNKLKPGNKEFIEHDKFDSSILNNLRDQEGNLNLDIPEKYNKKIEIRNTFLLYKAIKKLRNTYEEKKYKKIKDKKVYDMKQAYNFMHLINKRNIIEKNEYLSFIGADLGRKKETDDAHDGELIFSVGIKVLREKIVESSDYQYSTIITTKNSSKISLKNRINKINTLLKENKVWVKSKTKEAFAKEYVDSEFRAKRYKTTEDAAERYAETHWPAIEELLDEKKTNEDSLRNLSNDSISSEINFDSEVYKPYNMSRRMHVVLAFKGHSELLIDNTKSKLKVIK